MNHRFHSSPYSIHHILQKFVVVGSLKLPLDDASVQMLQVTNVYFLTRCQYEKEIIESNLIFLIR